MMLRRAPASRGCVAPARSSRLCSGPPPPRTLPLLSRTPSPLSTSSTSSTLSSAIQLSSFLPRRFAANARRAPLVKVKRLQPVPALLPTPEYKDYVNALANPDPKFAVIHLGGHQYKVTPGDVITVNKLEADVSSKIVLMKVLLLGSRAATAVGTPILEKAEVHATVEEQTLTDKVYVFKKRRRKSSQRTRGVRHPATLLRITDIKAEAYNI